MPVDSEATSTTVTVPPATVAGPYAFVFWNDDLTDEGVLAQLRQLAAAGFRGITLSARIGLSRRIGYLTQEYFRMVRLAVEECSRLGLTVMLYDEASYPSGSANGAVVAQNPAYAARCLLRVTKQVSGPVNRYWHPTLGRSPDQRLLAAIATPAEQPSNGEIAGKLLPVEDGTLVRLDLPAGSWQLTAVFDATSGGTIRGAFEDQDDGSALAPAAADLLNPDAVASFIALTHDAYAAALGEYLGNTVVAMFTDEPSLLGRDSRQDAVPYTTGFESDVAEALGATREEVLRQLPLLWQVSKPDDHPFTRAYWASLRQRLNQIYYGAQASWCSAAGIALTGHPAEGDDFASTVTFHWPGQDTVWRWVQPQDGTGLAGPESVAPKAAASAAHARGHAMSMAEVLGAYGWELTMDESKWLIDWYLSRGVTMPVLHAFFYSVRGNRAYESQPDLGPFNSWWPHLPPLVRYIQRIANLVTSSTQQVGVAVLGNPDHCPDLPARQLLQSQLDFFYLDPQRLDEAVIEDGALVLGDQRYRVLVDAYQPRFELTQRTRNRLEELRSAGILVVDAATWDAATQPYGTQPYGTELEGTEPDGVRWDAEPVRRHLRDCAVPVLTLEPASADLRVLTLRRGEAVVYLLFNEGESRIAGALDLSPVPADPHWFDPFTGKTWPASRADGQVRLVLERRQTLVLTDGVPCDRASYVQSSGAEVVGGRTQPLTNWRGTPTAQLGSGPTAEVSLGDWSKETKLARFSGTFRYTTTVEMPADFGDVVVDLGTVGEVSTLLVNRIEVAHLLWAPYRTTVPRAYLRPGTNHFEVLVSNSPANYYEGASRPAGLIGPVTIEYR